jgi:hypothetical protein
VPAAPNEKVCKEEKAFSGFATLEDGFLVLLLHHVGPAGML